MSKILKHIQAHYESTEVPFGKTYEWHPAYVALECDCGEKVTFSATSTTTTCRGCGAELGTFVHGIREREATLPDNLTHPWFHDATERAQQHKHDEAAYPEGSRWRYNDITAATNEE
jgi:ribosomal protein S27E